MKFHMSCSDLCADHMQLKTLLLSIFSLKIQLRTVFNCTHTLQFFHYNISLQWDIL